MIVGWKKMLLDCTLKNLDMVNLSITSSCVLRCPSCPTGRLHEEQRLNKSRAPIDYMPLEMCTDIFKKVYDLYGSTLFYLHIWNEPLIHPQIIQILRSLEDYGHSAYLSSNLNVRINFQELLSCKALKTFVISISGITEEVYKRGHRGGNLKLVLNNLAEIAKHTAHSSTSVIMNFHKYSDNAHDAEKLKLLCKDYGITFGPYPAVLLQSNVQQSIELSKFEAWQHIEDVNKYVIPRISMRPFPFTSIEGIGDIPCFSQSHILVLDYEGNICTCTHRESNIVERVGNFLELSVDAIENQKINAASCTTCRSLGLHIQYPLACFFEKPCGQEQDIINFIKMKSCSKQYKNIPIFIGGAGMDGAVMGPLLRHKNFNVQGFIDDDVDKIGKALYDIPIYSFEDVIPMMHNAYVLDTIRSLVFLHRIKSQKIKCLASMSAENFIASIMASTNGEQ